jgi:putative endonuclease
MKQPAIYILASRRHGTLYVGVTSHLVQRIWQHKNHVVQGFTADYNVHMLVYYELHAEMTAAIAREKQLKNWRRSWKIELIEKANPQWRDLWPSVLGALDSGSSPE